MSPIFAAPTTTSLPLHLIARAEAEDWLAATGIEAQNAAKTQNWSGKLGQILCLTEQGLPVRLAIGYGDTKPIASNDTEQGRQQNRRTSFTISIPK